jgi:hypothetical protein
MPSPAGLSNSVMLVPEQSAGLGAKPPDAPRLFLTQVPETGAGARHCLHYPRCACFAPKDLAGTILISHWAPDLGHFFDAVGNATCPFILSLTWV